MGIVIKQATSNVMLSYIGAALGFFTVAFVNVGLLSTAQNGLIGLLISITMLTGSLSNLGTTGVIVRLFPYFRNEEKNHYGFLFYPLVTTVVGFVLFLIGYFIFKDEIVARNIEKSKLFADQIFYLLPLTFFWAMFNIFDAYSRSIYLSTAGVFIKEVLLRIFVLIAALFLFLKWISFDLFLLIYCGSFCSVSIMLLIYILRKRQFHIKFDLHFLTPKLKGEMKNVAAFSIITGLSSLLISGIDKIIVNDKLGLQAVGVFTVATYFGSIIHIPARSIVRIAAPVVADSWKNNDLENIRSVYHKTCLNQFIIGSFMLTGIWICIDEVMLLLPAEYAEAKYVILLVGLGYLFDMATGVNGVILGTSKYYRFDTYFMLLLVVCTIFTNLALIPIYGLVGSAVAFCITYFVFNFLRFFFLWKKFGMQPYDSSFPKVIVVTVIAICSSWFLNFDLPPLLIIAIKGTVFSIVFVLLIYRLRVALELNAIADKYLFRKK